MCTNPITITRNYPLIGVKSFQVPCGKCAECVRKKQSEFAALSLHQSLTSGSLYFFTLTYDNDRIPVALSEDTPDGPRLIGFERGSSKELPWYPSEHNYLRTDEQGLHRCFSLRREDFKLHIKRFRNECQYREKYFGSEKWSLDKFKYATFGEVGEERGRPHYHSLVFGLSPEQADLFSRLWKGCYGFSHCGPVPGKAISLEDITKMTLYASKYISKGIYTRWAYLLPYMEKPRRQSSLNFGGFSEDELCKLSDFITRATYSTVEDSEFLYLFSWILYRLDARAFQLLAANSPSH